MTTTSAIAIFLAISAGTLWRARSLLKARASRFEDAKKAAWISLQTGSGKLPSWIGNEGKLSEFLFAVQKLAQRKGVPHRRVLEALSTESLFIQLASFAGALEFRNATFAEQQLAVADTIVQRFDYDERMRAESEIFFSNDEIQPADQAD